jgi:prophage regulatory protein
LSPFPTLPATGYLKLDAIIGPNGLIPISKSSWYAGIAAGEYPRPIKFGRTSLWRVEDIRALIERGA